MLRPLVVNHQKPIERLLLDCLDLGDADIIHRRTDEVHAAWTFMTDILEAWKAFPVSNPAGLTKLERGVPPGAR